MGTKNDAVITQKPRQGQEQEKLCQSSAVRSIFHWGIEICVQIESS